MCVSACRVNNNSVNKTAYRCCDHLGTVRCMFKGHPIHASISFSEILGNCLAQAPRKEGTRINVKIPNMSMQCKEQHSIKSDYSH